MTGFVLTADGQVPEAWIDANGHMNIMWYTSLFDRGCEVLLAQLGITVASVRDHPPTGTAVRRGMAVVVWAPVGHAVGPDVYTSVDGGRNDPGRLPYSVPCL